MIDRALEYSCILVDSVYHDKEVTKTVNRIPRAYEAADLTSSVGLLKEDMITFCKFLCSLKSLKGTHLDNNTEEGRE